MTLQADDVGRLFAVMRASYGNRWPHGADDVPVWLAKLRGFSADGVMRAADRAIDFHTEFPPTIGQFAALVRECVPALPNPAQENAALVERVYAYCRPESKSNPKGNPHKITLPESIAQRQPGEPPERYERRIADEVTLAMYPHLRQQFQR